MEKIVNRKNFAVRRDCAVIIGGSMAGLFAARVLADHFKRVFLLERDHYLQSATYRRGVPQGRHAHNLLPSGRQALEDLFPDIEAELVAAGAIAGDLLRDGIWHFEGGDHIRSNSDLRMLLTSRPLLEMCVRQRVERLPNVTIRDGSHAEALSTDVGNRRVTGVMISGQMMAADLVVDASGRGSRSLQWLEALGYGRPQEDRIEIGLTCTTRIFRRPVETLPALVMVAGRKAAERRSGVLLAQEGNTCLVTLCGYSGESAPAALEGFLNYAQRLATPCIYDAIRNAEPLGDAAIGRFPASVRHRYHDLPDFPEGFLVFGDAISSFNPFYGQGMSVAALSAKALNTILHEKSVGIVRQFFQQAAGIADVAWRIAADNDLQMPEAQGSRTLRAKLLNWYIRYVHRAAQDDEIVATAFHRVASLQASPRHLLTPVVLRRVLYGQLRSRAVKRAEVATPAATGINVQLER